MERAIRKRGGDADYILALYDASPRALKHIGKAVAMLDHREAVTIEAAYAAQIAGALSEGCGSCLQIHFDMASKAGVNDDLIANTAKLASLPRAYVGSRVVSTAE